MKKFAALKY